MSLSFAYLLLYNILQFFGWLWILTKTLEAAILDGIPAKDIFKTIGMELKIFQMLAVLEVINSVLGVVKTSVVIVCLRVASRLFVLWLVTDLVDEARRSIGVLIYAIAWSGTEVARFGFNAVSLIASNPPYFLKWFRYSLFTILYPIGIVGETITVLSAMPVVKRRRILSLDLPNAANMSFDYYYAMILVMLAYLPTCLQLYIHMWNERRQVLISDRDKKRT